MTQHIDIDIGSVRDPNEPAPAGTYTVQCRHAEVKNSKAGEAMVSIQLQIVGDGEEAGKMVFDNAMLEGGGAGMGRFRMQQYFQAVGTDEPDVDLLIEETFDVQLSVRPGNEQYPNPSNNVDRVFSS
jgi:hypothetical protein